MASDLAAGGGGSEDASTKEAEALAREADAMKRKEREAVGHLGGSVVPASGAGGTKRKGGELAAVEREAQRLKQAVPAEAVAAAAAAASAAAASNPEEIDLDDMEEEEAGGVGEAEGPTTTEDGKEIHVEGDRSFGVAAKAIPAAVFARAGFEGGEEEGEGGSSSGGGGERVGALARLKGKK